MRTAPKVLSTLVLVLLVVLSPDTVFGQQRDAPFLAGLRYYETEEYQLAAEAFRRSVDSNPFHRVSKDLPDIGTCRRA